MKYFYGLSRENVDRRITSQNWKTGSEGMDDVPIDEHVEDYVTINLMKDRGLNYDKENDLFYNLKYGALMFNFPEELSDIFFPEIKNSNPINLETNNIIYEKKIDADSEEFRKLFGNYKYKMKYKKMLKEYKELINNAKELGYELTIGPGTITNFDESDGFILRLFSSKYAIYCKNYENFIKNEKTR